ncbi:NADH:ubiquinone reductase (Na(+)-transporting) subunit B [Coprobacter tertius]|uniref:Na(+)-translocating NADH-quinone reductase subunit B n=1 Tax=Coprobacter tertius TaxID=2944915 RepID=A0ABT1MJC8_9BACT|nr:NADH:ubiquinone reductase (Na(+)-transporting) subunit B [Coprobacter tertius]MCP9612717.1 NADH:ubiquinone reductase (Na(+)-transporting) subunit B [Coprobacter tertius]
MKALRNYIDKIKPNFEPGGRFEKFQSVFEGFETFLFVPNTTSKSGTHIHDSIDTKRTMSVVIVALLPALLFGMYNVGYQHYLAIGQDAGFWMTFLFGFLAVLPQIVVSYAVGLGIEFTVAQMRGHEIQEGFLVSGILIPMIVPVDTPLWMIAVATAFAVIFAKEVFGGTGMNVFNVALITRAFLFFAYPSKMSGDGVFVRVSDTFGLGAGKVVEGFSGATPLGQVATTPAGMPVQLTDILGHPISTLDSFLGFIPGSIGETSTLAILIGAIILLVTRIASWRIMLSVFAGGLFMGWIANVFSSPIYPASQLTPFDQVCLGGFAFAAVFMATDPVTGARTTLGKYIYGFLIGVVAIIIRIYNNGYPEGAMLAVLLMNVFAPLIDYFVVEANMKKRLKRAKINA